VMSDAATNDGPRCPHGCRPTKQMRFVDDSWFCPKCRDEWPLDVLGWTDSECPTCGSMNRDRVFEACDPEQGGVFADAWHRP
jgi:hypothetical protein